MTRFSLEDADRAHDDWGANCGPGALAAIMDMTLDEVKPIMLAVGFEGRRYTNPAMMNAALRIVGRPWRKIGANWPDYGLVRVQWEGPWTQPGVPMAARYRYTHWIGHMQGRSSRGVFDINCMNNGTGWCALADWERVIAPLLSANYRRATGGWHVTHGIEVERKAEAR
jgi:hypothetical protein